MLNPPLEGVRNKREYKALIKLIICFIKISNFANKHKWYYKIGL